MPAFVTHQPAGEQRKGKPMPSAMGGKYPWSRKRSIGQTKLTAFVDARGGIWPEQTAQGKQNPLSRTASVGLGFRPNRAPPSAQCVVFLFLHTRRRPGLRRKNHVYFAAVLVTVGPESSCAVLRQLLHLRPRRPPASRSFGT